MALSRRGIGTHTHTHIGVYVYCATPRTHTNTHTTHTHTHTHRRLLRDASPGSPEVPGGEYRAIGVFDSRHTESRASHVAPARDVIVGQRILGQILGRKDKLKNGICMLQCNILL